MFAIEISYVYMRKMIEINSRHPGVFGPSLINGARECTLRNNKHIFLSIFINKLAAFFIAEVQLAWLR